MCESMLCGMKVAKRLTCAKDALVVWHKLSGKACKQ